MEFTYFKSTGVIFDKHGGYDGDDGYYFNYEVEKEELKLGVVELIINEHFDGISAFKERHFEVVRKGIYKFIDNYLDWDELIEEHKEELQDMFEEEAIANEDEI
jgi:hypothetical protein